MTIRTTQNLVLFFFLLAVSSCIPKGGEETASYLHIGHTRLYEKGNTIDPETEKIEFTKYDMIWIGGDLMGHSTEDRPTLNYLDSIFSFADPDVIWTLGNHDYDYHPEWIPEVTNRPLFYTSHKNGITILNLDSQKDSCSILGKQLDMVKQVTDTISRSSHLVVLTHKMVWVYGNDSLSTQAKSVPNAGFCDHCGYGINPNNYYSNIYPMLLEVKNKGIEVINIAGDIGAKVKSFEYLDENDIHFLASGVRSGHDDSMGLLFNHNLKKGTLEWEFKLLKDL
ncbi:MAG: metallophosphoesterase [Bacteroidota bacterium]